MVKKGQAAMEFLMTYGWAILVVLIAIGALAYFGVLSPGRFLPSSCTMGPGFSCEEFKVDNVAGDSLQIRLRNGIGKDIGSVTFNALEVGPGGACTVNAANPASVTDGGVGTFNWNCPSIDASTIQGSKFKATLTLIYTGSGDTLSHTVTGDITTKVE